MINDKTTGEENVQENHFGGICIVAALAALVGGTMICSSNQWVSVAGYLFVVSAICAACLWVRRNYP